MFSITRGALVTATADPLARLTGTQTENVTVYMYSKSVYESHTYASYIIKPLLQLSVGPAGFDHTEIMLSDSVMSRRFPPKGNGDLNSNKSK